MMKRAIRILTILILFSGIIGVFATQTSHAAPNMVNYQGSLTDSGGTPVPDASYAMKFRVYDDATAGTLLWEGGQTVATVNGIYNVLLGSGTPIFGSFDPGLFSNDNLWLEVEVSTEVLTPRQQVTSVAFALQAEEAATAGDADTVDGSHAVDFAGASHTHPGADITSQVGDADTVDGAHAAALEESAEIDADIVAHAGNASVHHAKTTRFTDLVDQADDAQLPAAIARDSEIMPTVLAGDGSGSTLDADLLDGLNSSAFMSSGTDNWVNITGDTMTGGLNVLANVGIGTAAPGYALEIQGGVDNYLGYFNNDNNASGTTKTFGIYAGANAYDTGTGNGYGGVFNGYGGSTSGNAYGTQNYAYAYGSSNAYGVWSNATAGTTTGREYAFYGIGDGYFSGNVGIGTTSPGQKLSVAGTIESTSGGMKFPDGTTQTTAATAGSFYGKVAIVAQSGGDYTDPKTAMDDLAAWCGTPSATNPCLVRIMPGIYDLGNNALTMQPYVDVEGSGENTTTITSTHSSATYDENSATVVGADNAEVRFLTVENLGGSTYALAVFNNSAAPKITNVTATASGGISNYSVFNTSSSPTLTNVTATASGGITNIGVYNYTSSSPTMTNVTATASGGTISNRGVYNISSSPTIKNCSISGTTTSITNSSSAAKVGGTMLDGLISGGGFTCVGAYDASFTALGSGCL